MAPCRLTLYNNHVMPMVFKLYSCKLLDYGQTYMGIYLCFVLCLQRKTGKLEAEC